LTYSQYVYEQTSKITSTAITLRNFTSKIEISIYRVTTRDYHFNPLCT